MDQERKDSIDQEWKTSDDSTLNDTTRPEITSPVNDVFTEHEFPGLKTVAIVMASLLLCMFLVALDRTIIGTAIPKITDDFHSLNDVGWYASSYLLTMASFQLIYGRIYQLYSSKWVLLCAIFIFEVGSALCGAAPSSNVFIFGRAVAGLGSGGIFGGAIILMMATVPLNRRPMFQGLFGAVFGLASVAGPLLGGVFTSKLSWRWCFYINLPIGAVVGVVLLLILKANPPKNTGGFREQIKRMDPYGTIVFLPGIISLLLALQWGGTKYAWSNARIIVLFILAGVLLGAFIAIQFWQGENATVPIRIIKQRSVASGAFFSFIAPSSMFVMVYYLPIWFQAIKGVNAVQSGIDTLPLVLSLVVASILAGAITAKTGYYTGQLIFCSLIMSIGAGLLTTLTVASTHQKWIGYQVIFGFGLGLGMQQSNMAAQTCLNGQDAKIGVSLMMFMQTLGGSIFISVAESIFTHSLIRNLSNVAGLNPQTVINTGATDLRTLVPSQYLDDALVAYNASISDVLKVAVACAAVSIIAGLTMEWRSVKGKKEGSSSNPKAEAEKV